MLPITLKDVKLYFDAPAILTPAEKFQRSLRMKFGASCRVIMRNSIKPASSLNQHAAAGRPPLYHNGPLNFRDTIFFVDDPKKKETVIGGVLLTNTAAKGEPVPGILEHGGDVLRVSSRYSRLRGGRRAPASISPHPYAMPAFQKTIDRKLPELIAGGVMREV